MRRRLPMSYRRRPTRSRSLNSQRLLLGLVILGFALFSYFGSKTYNPVTGENQYISITPHQEIALGLQALPHMLSEYGGLYPDERHQQRVDNIGNEIVNNSQAAETEWQLRRG